MNNTGTVVADAIVPLGNNPTHYDSNGQGGWSSTGIYDSLEDISWNDYLDSDGLGSGHRKAGMVVWVIQQSKAYVLDIPGFMDMNDNDRYLALQNNDYWTELKADVDKAYVDAMIAILQAAINTQKDRLDLILADAPDALNTFKEIIAQIQSDETGTAAMLATLNQHTTQIAVNTTAIATKVDKVTGKQLSTEDYTTAEKNKLAGLPSSVQNLTVEQNLASNSTTSVPSVKAVNEVTTNLQDTIYYGLLDKAATVYVDSADNNIQNQIYTINNNAVYTLGGASGTLVKKGWSNTANSYQSAVLAGESSSAVGQYSTVFSGYINKTLGHWSSVIGGSHNTVDATANGNQSFSTIVGSNQCTVSSNFSGIYNSTNSSIGAGCDYTILVGCNNLTVTTGSNQLYINNQLYTPNVAAPAVTIEQDLISNSTTSVPSIKAVADAIGNAVGTDLYNISTTIREAVVLGIYNTSNELTTTITDSVAGMKFSYQTHMYEYMPGDTGTLVWIRMKK